MVLEIEGMRLLTDPGSFTDAQNTLTELDAVLITHEHQDHLHVESLKVVLDNNPTAVVVGNASVAKVVGEAIADTQVSVVGDGQSTEIRGVKIEGIGGTHEEIYKDYGMVENTGYLVEEKFYFPGDSFHNPEREVDVLALPVAGPWMTIGRAITYALEVRPRIAFGVHDGMMKHGMNLGARLAEAMLPKEGIEFVSLENGETREF